MKITHVCLCGPVTDGWTYQDNLLPKYHKRLGYETSVITSQYIYGKNNDVKIDQRSMYYNEYGIKTIRLKSKYNTTIYSKFKFYKDVYETIVSESPDILFVHGVQFLNIKDIVKYLKKNPHVVTFVDNHADFSNSATNIISKSLLHGLIWRKCAQLIEPYTTKFYGVLPARVDFLKKIYKLPEDKVELLVMGADDEKVQEARQVNVKKEIREKYNIRLDDFLIITGGKIDNAKRQTLFLMQAIKKINNPKVKLIIFGSVIEELQEKFNTLVDDDKIKYIGWVSSEDSYKYFASADLVIFPGRHSVFWEQVVGLGIPMIVKYWEGTDHVNIGGNCEFLYQDSIEEIEHKVNLLLNNPMRYNEMKNKAETFGKNQFSYENIAKRSIEI
ncbi:glycosyltransferase family 4 protein [Cerasibacillus terrae]|uniref:Glycosyltransferase family 4 protein n=1 Tax=Cerasibacillus terrae TaxID=2498845 RepID=A0A5C8P0F4_9BACI|nr:glycosyltransferase family 4 protein [Cerasibacillus terrae]TXL66773.1 glycosyltransferase family 4 protein [Cerasibacillus terrae]